MQQRKILYIFIECNNSWDWLGDFFFFTLGQDKSIYMMFYAGCLSHKGCVRMSVVGFFQVFFVKSVLM
jgi:hypothetical protein